MNLSNYWNILFKNILYLLLCKESLLSIVIGCVTVDSKSRKYNLSTIQFYEDGYLYSHVNVFPVNFQLLKSTNNNKIPYIVVFTREILSNILNDKKKKRKGTIDK